MALSEEEQRLLEQMEAALAAEDPKLAHTLRGTRTRRFMRRRAAIAGAVFVVGRARGVPVGEQGLEFGPVVSIVGFVLMLAATVTALTSWQQIGDDGSDGPAVPRTPNDPSDFMDRLEERWRRHQDDA